MNAYDTKTTMFVTFRIFGESIIINLLRHGDVEAAYDAIFGNPVLSEELERDDLTACEMVERIKARN